MSLLDLELGSKVPMMLSEKEIASRLKAALERARGSVAYSEIDAVEGATLKSAAVLVPLLSQENAWHILYTRRTQRVESHKGQVSFPGGASDKGETSPEQTALRELQEEIGVDPASVRLLGRLAPMITISNYRVTPVVGVLEWPTVFRLSDHEVERIFTVPLEWLAESGNRWELPFPGSNRGVVVYHPFDGELLWGATARMTVELMNALAIQGQAKA